MRQWKTWHTAVEFVAVIPTVVVTVTSFTTGDTAAVWTGELVRPTACYTDRIIITIIIVIIGCLATAAAAGRSWSSSLSVADVVECSLVIIDDHQWPWWSFQQLETFLSPAVEYQNVRDKDLYTVVVHFATSTAVLCMKDSLRQFKVIWRQNTLNSLACLNISETVQDTDKILLQWPIVRRPLSTSATTTDLALSEVIQLLETTRKPVLHLLWL